MEIVYNRNVSHCEVTTYVKEVTIKSVETAFNSDRLDKITFEEIGWNCITGKDLYHIGDKVWFVPPETVLPVELSDILDITKYLSKGRVKVACFRGNRSEGIIVPKEVLEPYLPYLMKWEDPPSVSMRGDGVSLSNVNPNFHKFYKMPNLLNEPYTFERNEIVYFSEKIHGTSGRWSKLPHPVTGEMTLYVGSHNVVLKNDGHNVYCRIARKIEHLLPEGITFFGEVFGPGIQHLTYGVKDIDVRLFAASINGMYLPVSEFMEICEEYKLPHVNFYYSVFDDIEKFRKIADEPSSYDGKMREGIVLRSVDRPSVMAKVIGFSYLTSKGRIERH